MPVPVWIDANGFNDHSVPAVPSVSEFFALARPGVTGASVVKFSITDMRDRPGVAWLDSNFFTLHDEWFWFRLLNGAAVSGSKFDPVEGLSFATVAEIYDWALAMPVADLPLDLQFVGSQTVGSRLYSDHFYELALDVVPRVLGVGSVVNFPTAGGDRWLIELEYHDDPTPSEVATFFDLLAGSLPADIGDNLEWVIRSPEQEDIAQQMANESLPFHDRVVRYSELVPPGQIAVYNDGIAAGRLLLIGEGGKELNDAGDNDIVLVENVPDFLPPGRALISSSPQTPLAHVNILARNRGIPNASQAGLLADAGIRQAARVRAPAIVRARAPDQLEIVLITEEEYTAWQQLNTVTPIRLPPVDAGNLENVVDLEALSQQITSDADLAAWRPVIGGKAAGFLNLMAPEAVESPGDPVAITVRPYLEHLATAEPALSAVLENDSFRNSARTRYLLLEGPAAYLEFYGQPEDRAFGEAFGAAHPPGTAVGDVLRAGGLQSYLRDLPMNPATRRDIEANLLVAYGEYALSQGLRFRSSSSVEDIEGFTGAGLYESNTGFLRPDIQLRAVDQTKSIEWALKATWASYWGFEAYEERRREAVDHRSGAMAVLVHARFDDPLELGNGVLTFTIEPEVAATEFTMTLNAQDGAVSVTNPDPVLQAAPEIVVVTERSGAVAIERIAASNRVAAGVEVLGDEQLRSLFEQAKSVAILWRDRINATLPLAQRITTLTLDFEFKEMAAGWPALKGGLSAQPPRLVLKQSRALEPSLRQIPRSVRELAIPRDILARARFVERLACPTSGADAIVVSVLTDPLLVPDVGFGESPFILEESPGFDGNVGRCSATTLYSTPDHFLIELLAVGRQLNLSP